MSDFLPDDYKLDDKSNYMKFKPGDNRFRVMSKPIVGYEWWVDKDGDIREKGAQPQSGDKPARVRMTGTVPIGAADTVKHFWAMVVWNYVDESFQILQITQKSIQKSIKSLSADEDWGSPLNYDLVVTKTGEKLDTEYEVKPKPAKPLADEITEAYKKTNINLEALYEGKNPFSNEQVNEVVEDLDDLPI